MACIVGGSGGGGRFGAGRGGPSMPPPMTGGRGGFGDGGRGAYGGGGRSSGFGGRGPGESSSAGFGLQHVQSCCIALECIHAG